MTVLIVDDSLVGKPILVVPSIAALRKEQPTAGRCVHLVCHTRPGDGGHGELDAVTGAPPGTFADDGGTVVLPADGDGSAAWLRQYTELHVRMFGCDGVDDVPAFERAATAAHAALNEDNAHAAATNPEEATVRIPPGKYALPRRVNTAGRFINWVADDGAEFDNAQADRLGTALVRTRRTNMRSVGTRDSTCVQSFILNSAFEDCAGIAGYTNDAQVGGSASGPNARGAAALYLEANTRDPYAVGIGTQYFLQGVIIENDIDWDGLLVGMILQTDEGITERYAGRLVGWAELNRALFVSGWYRLDGESIGEDPAAAGKDGVPIVIDYQDRVWALHANVVLRKPGVNLIDPPTALATGWELGVYNQAGDYDPTRESRHRAIGIDAASGGPYKGKAAYIARGRWYYGVLINGATDFGLAFMPADAETTPPVAIHSKPPAPIAVLLEHRRWTGTANELCFQIDGDGNLEVGPVATPANPYIDFHSSGNNTGFDVRLTASGGGASNGAGKLKVTAGGGLQTTGPLLPNSASVLWTTGAGSPEGVLAAPPGSLYTNTAGGVGSTLWVKESGTGNTGWAAK